MIELGQKAELKVIRSLSNKGKRLNLPGVKRYSHPRLREVSLVQVLQALSDPGRVAIVRALARARERGLPCGEIPLKVSKATRSHHFDVLRAAGVISTRCEGTRCLSSLRRRELDRRFPGLLRLILSRG